MNSKILLTTLLLALPLAAPAAERLLLPARSEVGFSIKQMGVSVSGVFRRYHARIVLDPAQVEQARAEIEVETASLSTGDADADAVAVDKPWLDAAGFPRARFVSTAVRALAPNRYEAEGELSLRGRTQPLKVPFTLTPAADGGAVASGQFRLQRAAFGIGGGEWNEGDLVAPEFEVRFRLALAPPR